MTSSEELFDTLSDPNEWKNALKRMETGFRTSDADLVEANAAFCFYLQNRELRGLPEYLEVGSPAYVKEINFYVDGVVAELRKHNGKQYNFSEDKKES